MKSHNSILRLIISALCLALAYTLPFLTLSSPQLGSMLLLMHIPVLLCGFLCGWQWGLSVGFIAPLLRSLTIGAPVFPTMAICMALQLASYGAFSGLTYKLLPKKKPFIYVSLLISMLVGRIVFGISMAISMGIGGEPYSFSMFIASSLTGAIPGIVIQIVFVPILVMVLKSQKGLRLND